MTPSALVEPAFFTFPDYHQTFGDQVAELATLAGFAPDPEQQLVLDPMFGVDRHGMSVAFEVCVIGSRQNIKTGLMKIAALGKTVVMERPLFVWSAHEFRTSQEAFRDLTAMIESTPDLDQHVKKISRANGDEAIEWLGGQRIIFKARTHAGGRGLTGDDVGLDEAFALRPEHMGALLPTLSAREDPQVFYGSSAGQAESTILRGIRDRGRAGKSRRLVYAEWCAPDPAVACDAGEDCTHEVGVAGCGFDKRDMVRRANPQLGRRITWSYICAERQALPPAEFGRERMGWWDAPAGAGEPSPIDFARWQALVDAERGNAPERMAAFAVEVDLDRAWSSIGAAGYRADGRVHLEMVDRRRDTDWIVGRCVELDAEHGPAEFAVDGGGPAKSLIVPLKAAGLNVTVLNTGDIGNASADVVDAVKQGTVAHGPQTELDDAVKGAQKRQLGDGAFAIGRKKSTVDVTPLVAVALARHLAVMFGPDDVTNEFG